MLPRNTRFSADDFRLERSMFIEKLWEGWIIAVHKIRECWRWMSNETRRKNVRTEFSNVYSTYSMSEIFGNKSSRRVSSLIFNEHMIGKWSVGEIGKEMTVGDEVELADIKTRSRVWECWWVENKTCWVIWKRIYEINRMWRRPNHPHVGLFIHWRQHY